MKRLIALFIAAIAAVSGCGTDKIATSSPTRISSTTTSVVAAESDYAAVASIADTFWLIDPSSVFWNEFEPYIVFGSTDSQQVTLTMGGSDGCNGFGAEIQKSDNGLYELSNGSVTEVGCVDFVNSGMGARLIRSGPVTIELSADGETLTIDRLGEVLLSRVDEDPRNLG